MLGRLYFLGTLLCWLVPAPSVCAATVEISATFSGVESEPIAAQLTAQPVNGVFGGQAPDAVSTDVTVPGTARFALPGNSVWSLELVAPGYFTPAAFVAPGEAASVTMRLWPTARLVGEAVAEPGEEPPAELGLRFTPAGLETPAELAGTVLCPVVGKRFECELPAGAFDLRLRAGGFVSHYLWGISLASGEVLLSCNERPGRRVRFPGLFSEHLSRRSSGHDERAQSGEPRLGRGDGRG